MWGSHEAVVLATLAVDITLQQRSGKMKVDFMDLEKRTDVIHTEVPIDAVGFVLGNKGQTLRQLETRFKTFMFFDNEHKRDNCKRLYIISASHNSRDAALREVEDVVRFKITKESNRGKGGGYQGSNFQSNYNSGGGRGYSPRRRSYSRSRTRSRSPVRRDRSRSLRR